MEKQVTDAIRPQAPLLFPRVTVSPENGGEGCPCQVRKQGSRHCHCPGPKGDPRS